MYEYSVGCSSVNRTKAKWKVIFHAAFLSVKPCIHSMRYHSCITSKSNIANGYLKKQSHAHFVVLYFWHFSVFKSAIVKFVWNFLGVEWSHSNDRANCTQSCDETFKLHLHTLNSSAMKIYFKP